MATFDEQLAFVRHLRGMRDLVALWRDEALAGTLQEVRVSVECVNPGSVYLDPGAHPGEEMEPLFQRLRGLLNDEYRVQKQILRDMATAYREAGENIDV